MKLGRITATTAAGLLAVAAGLFSLAPSAYADTASTTPATAHVAAQAIANTGSLKAPAMPAALKAQAAAARSICYDAYVQNIAWQGWVCDGAQAGTTGQSLRMEAIAIETFNVGGWCAQAQVQNYGWLGTLCVSDGYNDGTQWVGTQELSLRLETLRLSVGTGNICANAHVQNIGWQGVRCTPPFPVEVGTVGQSLRMEAIRITV